MTHSISRPPIKGVDLYAEGYRHRFDRLVGNAPIPKEDPQGKEEVSATSTPKEIPTPVQELPK